MNISLPDGSVRTYPDGTTGFEIAQSISEGLARNALAIAVNGEVRDLHRPIEGDAAVSILTWDSEGGQMAFWHSSAHLMAEALEALYPGVQFGIGPAIEGGFYYDVGTGAARQPLRAPRRVEGRCACLLPGEGRPVQA